MLLETDKRLILRNKMTRLTSTVHHHHTTQLDLHLFSERSYGQAWNSAAI